MEWGICAALKHAARPPAGAVLAHPNRVCSPRALNAEAVQFVEQAVGPEAGGGRQRVDRSAARRLIGSRAKPTALVRVDVPVTVKEWRELRPLVPASGVAQRPGKRSA